MNFVIEDASTLETAFAHYFGLPAHNLNLSGNQVQSGPCSLATEMAFHAREMLDKTRFKMA